MTEAGALRVVQAEQIMELRDPQGVVVTGVRCWV